MILTVEAFEKAAVFVAENARDLEVARFAVHFEEGGLDDVDEELRAYRNDDGGFAYGLEPDFRCEESSAAATVSALEILSETGAPPDSDLVQGAVAYLLKTYDVGLHGWQKVPPSVNDYPHAEWWHYPDGGAVSTAPEWWGLTNADVVAYLHDYPMLVPAGFLEMVTREAVSRLFDLPEAMDMHSFAAYQRLAMRIDPERRVAMIAKLSRVALAIVDKDPEHWSGYVPSPLYIAPSISSPLATMMAYEVQDNLDFEVASQQPDGSWRPRWRWQCDPEGWAQAEPEWAGIVTLKTLLQLRDYDRIDDL